MQLVRPAHRGPVGLSRDYLEEVREIGERLAHISGRYERLVRDIGYELAPPLDLATRMRLLNREVALIACSLQDVLLARRESPEETTT